MEFSDLIKQLVIGLTITGTTLLGQFAIKKWEKRWEPDLSDPDFEDSIKDLLDLIREETGAVRVSYWEGSNGTNTLSGYHIKKLSMMGESNKIGLSDISEELQMIPISTFKRNMDKLRDSKDGLCVSYEFEMNDDLANLNKGYDINTLYMFKVKTIFNKWTGILTIGYEEKPKNLNDIDKAWLKTQASRIGTLIRTKNAGKKGDDE